LVIAVPDLCIIAKKRLNSQNPNTASISLTVVESAVEGHIKRTEEVGFEPTVPCRTSVFKTDAIGHSATLPEAKVIQEFKNQIKSFLIDIGHSI
jgi:hypothetical protein